MKTVLDVCCGSKMFWFDNDNKNAIYGDIRSENHILCDGRKLEIKPDVIFSFTCLPFVDNYFKVVVFDPPHLKNVGKKSWMYLKYGGLSNCWKSDLTSAFNECFRVLDTDGMLIFKWNETQIKTSDILKLTNEKPLMGHLSGKRSNTHWVTFMKK